MAFPPFPPFPPFPLGYKNEKLKNESALPFFLYILFLLILQNNN